jgi:hypothetical protein
MCNARRDNAENKFSALFRESTRGIALSNRGEDFADNDGYRIRARGSKENFIEPHTYIRVESSSRRRTGSVPSIHR